MQTLLNNLVTATIIILATLCSITLLLVAVYVVGCIDEYLKKLIKNVYIRIVMTTLCFGWAVTIIGTLAMMYVR